MSWYDELFKRVRREYDSGPFRIEDVILKFKEKHGYSSSQIYKGFTLLVKEEKLFRIYKGVYDYEERKQNKEISITKSIFIKNIESLLTKKGINYMLTGPSLLTKFFHHLPRNNFHLIYLLKGSGEYALSLLIDEKYSVLLNPKKRDLRNYLTHNYVDDILILREYSSLDGNINGTAEIERIMIDTYFESTRENIPITPREIGRIFRNIFRNYAVKINKLLKYSWKRGINEEIKIILNEYYNKELMDQNISYKKNLHEVILGMRE